MVESQQGNQDLVVVTGASGYLAGHVINQLLNEGFRVRGTVRSLKNKLKNDHIYNINPEKKEFLELVEAELLDKECWNDVVKGSKYVCHVASPFPSVPPKHENELIIPAKEGTENVFLASINQGVKKIVITSSIAAVFSGRMDKNQFDEKDWSNQQKSEPYEKSKTIAEETAWKIYNQHKDKIMMTTINPAFIQGPSFHGNDFTSSTFITRVLNDDFPGIPKISLAICDVREVAAAHVQAILRAEKTNGSRYIISEHSYWMEDLINMLREEFAPKGYSIVSMTVAKCMFSIVAMFDKQAKLLKPFYGRLILFDNTKSQYELGVQYRTCKETMIDMYHFIQYQDIFLKIQFKQQFFINIYIWPTT